MAQQTLDQVSDLRPIDTSELSQPFLAPLSESALKRALIEALDPARADRAVKTGFESKLAG